MTIKDIARESGYAISTVSRALNNHPDVSEEARLRIQAVVSAHSFVPNNNARQLKQQQSQSILILVKGISNVFLSSMLERMQSAVADAGYTTQCHYLDEDANEVLIAQQLCREQKPLGIIFLGGGAEHFSGAAEALPVPCVLATSVSRESVWPNLSMVGIDDAAAAKQAVDYLFGKGHTAIAVIGGNENASYISAQRRRGCEESFAAHGLALLDAYETANFSYASAYRAMQRLLARKTEMTAVFCMSDTMAIGAVRAIRDAGLSVPGDISVIGFDGIELARFYDPKLATITQPGTEIARKSVELLVGCIEKDALAETVLVGVSLTEGDSVRTL